MWYPWQRRPSLPLILALLYGGFTWYSLRQSSLPSKPCRGDERKCVHPLVAPGESLFMELWLYQPADETFPSARWTSVDTCRLQLAIPRSERLPQEITNSDQNCTITLPEAARIRWSDHGSTQGGPLRAMFRFRQVVEGPIVAEVPLMLTRIVTRTSSIGSIWNSDVKRARKLLEPADELANDVHGRDTSTYVPHFRYGLQPVLLRFVAEYRPYGGPPPYYRGDGIRLSVPAWNRSAYRPMIYVDDNGLQHATQREVAPPSEGFHKPPTALRIKISAISPWRDALNRQLTMGLSMIESMLPGSDLDEFRYWLRDERLYRFLLTQVISFVHVWIDYLAFRDEVRFYRGRSDLGGVSVSSVTTRLLCSVIIFLYLMDGGGTSWVVLLSVFSGVAVEAWKVWRLLRPTIITTFPYVVVRQLQSPIEKKTSQYDRIAMTYLMLILYPIVIGWSLYDLKHNEYSSWYSWLISNLANAVYTFGFIALCPQLYVNYRLKSVAHLPWKVFLYKVFNTFVDDVFAFLIDMPWKHRIMTLRDDVVFVMFLVQAYMYRVDKSRTNEFGYSYEDEDAPHHLEPDPQAKARKEDSHQLGEEELQTKDKDA